MTVLNHKLDSLRADGSSGRAMWMHAMGFIQAAFGSCYLMKHYALALVSRRAAARAAVKRGAPIMLPGAGRVDVL